MIWCHYQGSQYAQKKPVLYALEVNKGWFKRNGFHVGDFINISAVIQNAK